MWHANAAGTAAIAHLLTFFMSSPRTGSRFLRIFDTAAPDATCRHAAHLRPHNRREDAARVRVGAPVKAHAGCLNELTKCAWMNLSAKSGQ
jgi:hypothetical protein